MSTYHHGVRVTETSGGARPNRAITASIIGMVVTAPAADAELFPVNQLVQVTSVSDAIGSIGATGTGKAALEAIKDQGSPVIHLIVVPEGATPADTTANVIGANENGVRTGLQLLRTAKQKFGSRPNILGVPDLDTLAVAVELGSIAADTKSFAYIRARKADDSPAETVAEAVAYRGNFGNRELMVLHPDWLVTDDAGEIITGSSVARALGLRALIDETQGWHRTISNIPVQGVQGISTDVSWELQDPSSDAGVLNASEVTTAINEKGFRFWGSRTCSTDPLFAFESATRTAQVIAELFANAHLNTIDKPLYASLATDVIEGLKAEARQLIASGQLLGFDAWVDPTKNESANISSGILNIDYSYTPVPPLENLNLTQRITDSYLLDFAQNVQQ